MLFIEIRVTEQQHTDKIDELFKILYNKVGFYTIKKNMNKQ